MAHFFRGMTAWVLLGVFLQAAPASKEPSIAVGTPADTVIRTYGRPNGQITTGTREIWTYDRFRVMFEKGRVLNVASIPARLEGSPPVDSQTPPASASNPVHTAGPPAKAPAYPITLGPGGSITEPAAAAKSSVRTAPATRPPARPAERATGGLTKIALVVMFVALGVAIGVVFWAHSKTRSLEDKAAAQALAARDRHRGGS